MLAQDMRLLGQRQGSFLLQAQQALSMMLAVVLLSLSPWGDWEVDTTRNARLGTYRSMPWGTCHRILQGCWLQRHAETWPGYGGPRAAVLKDSARRAGLLGAAHPPPLAPGIPTWAFLLIESQSRLLPARWKWAGLVLPGLAWRGLLGSASPGASGHHLPNNLSAASLSPL